MLVEVKKNLTILRFGGTSGRRALVSAMMTDVDTEYDKTNDEDFVKCLF